MSDARTQRTPVSTGRVRVNDIPVEPRTSRPETSTPASRGFVEGLTEAVRANPASAALIGIGAAWLLTGGANVSLLGGSKRANPFRFGRSARYNADHHFADESAASGMSFKSASAGGSGTSPVDTVGSPAERVGSAASAAATHGSSGLSAAYEGLGSAAGRVGEAASNAGSSAYDASRSVARGARAQTENLQQTLGEFFEDKPLALGILGLAIGAGLAAALPRTEIERQFMGEASDAAKEHASSIVAAKLDDAKAVAGQIFDQVSGEVEAQGLSKDGLTATAQTLGDKLSTVADAAAKSAKSEVEGKGGSGGTAA
ncbi:hypothetical protein [Aureimonas leprariae]|uniref:DUF3618 domain-containing protein n=1 Tax=Plantimonas leprariae TaxID=2615207 RepID=A0A7V7PKA7_9HYPH|nr:hypothetical protein [Aureimonas leprariae]KAB0676177.1 hypothetical protein F6X38_21770 [Aureimonas leprariae]